MQIPKLQVLIEAGVVRDIEVIHDDTAHGWTVRITYASRTGERCEVLERQRGGARGFATLDAVARCLAGLGYRVEWNDYGRATRYAGRRSATSPPG